MEEISNPDHWPQLELRHLQALHAVAEEGTFWGAADRLDCSQSAVSQQVAALERIVGQRLVERWRGRRKVELTEAGRLLLRHADAVVSQLEAARADLRALAAGAAGTLRVGTYQSVAARIVPVVLQEFRRAWPAVAVELTEHPTDEQLMDQLRTGRLDLSFAVAPLSEGPFDSVELLRDPYVLMVPSRSPLAEGTTRLGDLAGAPLVGYRYCRTIDQAEGALRRAGVEPRVVFRSDDNGTVQGMVRAGLGVALAPRLAVDESDPGVRVLSVEGLPERVILLAWHRNRYRPPAASAFVQTARAVCSRLAREAVAD